MKSKNHINDINFPKKKEKKEKRNSFVFYHLSESISVSHFPVRKKYHLEISVKRIHLRRRKKESLSSITRVTYPSILSRLNQQSSIDITVKCIFKEGRTPLSSRLLATIGSSFFFPPERIIAPTIIASA